MLHGEQTRDTDAERHEFSLNLLQKLCERPHRVEAKSSILSLSMLLLGCVHARGQQAHRAGGDETVAREDPQTATETTGTGAPVKKFVSRSPFIQVLRRRTNVAEVGPMEAFKTPLRAQKNS